MSPTFLPVPLHSHPSLPSPSTHPLARLHSRRIGRPSRFLFSLILFSPRSRHSCSVPSRSCRNLRWLVDVRLPSSHRSSPCFLPSAFNTSLWELEFLTFDTWRDTEIQQRERRRGREGAKVSLRLFVALAKTRFESSLAAIEAEPFSSHFFGLTACRPSERIYLISLKSTQRCTSFLQR